MDSRKPFIIRIIVEQDFLGAKLKHAIPAGLVLATDPDDAHDQARRRWLGYEVLRPQFWDDVPDAVRLDAIINDQKQL